MLPLRVQESDTSTDTSSSDSMQQLDDYLNLESATSRLSLQSANNQNRSTLRRSNRTVEDQENRPPAVRPQQTRKNAEGGETGAAGPAPRRRKQRGPVSRANQMNREIRRLRACTTPLIPRLPFSRLVREVITNYTSSACRITESALEALQESSELYLTHRFQDAYLLTHHRGRVTLEVRDMALIAYIIENCRS
uniref:Cid1 n=1 Tax=Drosophila nikananu TaxID=73157 RepID=A0A1V0HRJ2_9MUSC|nr:Cid1 [Drosophila nikananu]